MIMFDFITNSDAIKIILSIPVIVMAGVLYVLLCFYLGLGVYKAHLFIKSCVKIRSLLWYKTKKKFKKDLPPYVAPVPISLQMQQLNEDRILKEQIMKEEQLLDKF